MLQQLYIKNVALIDEALVEFDKGLNILSGETGAGKSIIIGSLAFVLGARGSKDFIKKGEDKAIVEALLIIQNKTIKKEIEELGIEISSEDCSIVISRSFSSSGKNICKVNNRPATLGMLKEICEKFIDIHGQHEHQSLLNSNKHIILLDRFCELDLVKPKEELSEFLSNYKEVIKQISEITIGRDKEELKDFFTFQINEIENANLKENEETKLFEDRKMLLQAENLSNLYKSSSELLYSGDENTILGAIGTISKNMLQISEIDSSKKYIHDEIQEIYAKLDDISRDLKKYEDGIEFDETSLNIIENRIDLIQKLKKKYGNSITEILKFKDATQEKLENLTNSEARISELYKQKENLELSIKSTCESMSNIRKEKAQFLENKIETHLKDLGMESTFKIGIERKSTFSQNGFDKVEFLIKTNAGEDLKPLSKIASGGEMSRVMLSLKAVLSFVDNIDTFIFDEIDAGISGRTAQMVAEKMSFLSTKNQIICITHLPQIAAMSDQHFLIDKISSANKTETTIKKLHQNDVINELARMTGGVSITQSTLLSAKEMKEQANIIKEQIKKPTI